LDKESIPLKPKLIKFPGSPPKRKKYLFSKKNHPTKITILRKIIS